MCRWQVQQLQQQQQRQAREIKCASNMLQDYKTRCIEMTAELKQLKEYKETSDAEHAAALQAAADSAQREVNELRGMVAAAEA